MKKITTCALVVTYDFRICSYNFTFAVKKPLTLALHFSFNSSIVECDLDRTSFFSSRSYGNVIRDSKHYNNELKFEPGVENRDDVEGEVWG